MLTKQLTSFWFVLVAKAVGCLGWGKLKLEDRNVRILAFTL